MNNERKGAIADRNCMNPECLAEEGERHYYECTRDESDNVTPIGGEVQKWADAAMYRSEAMPERISGQQVTPLVYLLNATPDPLGAIAAGSMMYEGKVCRSLSDVTDEERRHYFDQITKTHLKAPFELMDLHFMVEGVTRSFTHQMVRQRTAVFMQESLRFAVKENMDEETPLPPSLADMKDDDPRVVLWRRGINAAQDIYEALVDSGVPAEDARGLLPHSTTTRLNYKTNLRNLQDHGGMRLCTQAQFEWRTVFLGFVKAISEYCSCPKGIHEVTDSWAPEAAGPCDNWQFQIIANLFRPVCYLTGKCEFKASFDRACSIRDRVEANHKVGRGSETWNTEYDVVEGNPIVAGVGPRSVMVEADGRPVFIGAIQPAEWLGDHSAARTR